MPTQLQKATDEMEDARECSRKIQAACDKGAATVDTIGSANDRLSIAIDEWRRTYSLPAAV
jgi:hypothetical protein